MCAYGCETVTFAQLAYRPQTLEELRYLLGYLKKQELQEEFARNTMSLLLRAVYPKLKRPLYSEFVKETEKKKNTDKRTGREIVDDLIARIKKRKARRKKQSGAIHAGGETET